MGTRLHDYTALAPRMGQRRRLHVADRSTAQDARIDEALAGDADRLVALINHELRTPLAMMIGCTEMLREGDAGMLTEDQALLVEGAERGAVRVQELVLDLLTLAGHALAGDRCPEQLAEAVRRLGGDLRVEGLPGGEQASA